MLTQTPSSSLSAPTLAAKSTTKGQGWRIFVTVLLMLSVLLMVGYSAVSIYIALRIMDVQRMPIDTTPT